MTIGAGRVVVDTNVVIDAARGRGTAPAWLAMAIASGTEILVSAITLAEYASGVAPGLRDEGIAFLESRTVLVVTPAIAIRAGEIRFERARRGRTVSLPDALIAATALEAGAPLVTSNVRDFAIDGLDVVQPVVAGES